nr:PREDICTED: endochitinase A-like isoform X1 [Bemisia tabaci]
MIYLTAIAVILTSVLADTRYGRFWPEEPTTQGEDEISTDAMDMSGNSTQTALEDQATTVIDDLLNLLDKAEQGAGGMDVAPEDPAASTSSTTASTTSTTSTTTAMTTSTSTATSTTTTTTTTSTARPTPARTPATTTAAAPWYSVGAEGASTVGVGGARRTAYHLVPNGANPGRRPPVHPNALTTSRAHPSGGRVNQVPNLIPSQWTVKNRTAYDLQTTLRSQGKRIPLLKDRDLERAATARAAQWPGRGAPPPPTRTTQHTPAPAPSVSARIYYNDLEYRL